MALYDEWEHDVFFVLMRAEHSAMCLLRRDTADMKKLYNLKLRNNIYI
jgi:hypothetical protein